MGATTPLETLRAIGAEAICAKTHIALKNVRALLAEDFEQFSSIQFNGFATIIEREFDLDLTALRTQYAQTNPEPEPPLSEQEDDPFAKAVKDKRHHRVGVMLLAGMLLSVILVTYMVLGGSAEEKKIELNNTAIEAAQANMARYESASSEGTRAEADAIQETHQGAASDAAVYSEAVRYEDVIIQPRSKVWLGVIDADTHKRSTRTTENPWRLDGSHNWLIVTGHGILSLECGGQISSYTQRERLLFVYEAGQCRQVDEATFKARNRGRVW